MTGAHAPRSVIVVLVLGAALSRTLSAQELELIDTGPTPPPPDTLWYNGDWDPRWRGGLHNNIEWTILDRTEMVFEDFVVPDAAGWTVTSVWSNNITNSRVPITAARWQIRKGMKAGSLMSGGGGELVASGISPATAALHRTACPSAAPDVPPYRPLPCFPFELNSATTITVSDLSVFLPPGTYWVGVAPVIVDYDQSLPTDTLGVAANAIGISGGVDNAYVWQRSWYFQENEFVLSNRFSSLSGPPNYSLGVAGRIGGGPVDSDGDGLRDDVDACPNQNPMGRDADGDGCTDSAAGLGNLVKTLPMAAEMRAPLTAKVVAAEAAQQRGQRNAAINQLSALLNQIRAQRGKKIPIATADLLDAYIRNVILAT